MSDVSQGPGWWQASDDNWYPPEDHPDYQAALAAQAAEATQAAQGAQDAQAGQIQVAVADPMADPASGNGEVAGAPDEPATPVSTTSIGFGSVPGTPTRPIPGSNITLPPPMPAPGGMATPQGQMGKVPSQISLTYHSEMYLGAGAGGGGGVSQLRSRLRKHSTVILIGLVVVVAVAGGLGYYLTRPKSTSPSAVNPALARSAPYLQLLSQAVTAANATGSVHVVGTGNLGNGAGSTETGDIGPNGTSISATSPDDGNYQLIISGGVPYALGDVTFLESAGFDAMSASQYQNQWLEFPTSIPGIQADFKSISIKALIDPYLMLTGVVTETQASIGGVAVINLTGEVPDSAGPGLKAATATISLTAASPHLPVQAVIGGTNGGTLTLSNWGEPVAPAPPANPVNVVNIATNAQ